MFSIAFDRNTSQTWLINFAITTIGDILIKDVIMAIILASFIIGGNKAKVEMKRTWTRLNTTKWLPFLQKGGLKLPSAGNTHEIAWP